MSASNELDIQDVHPQETPVTDPAPVEKPAEPVTPAPEPEKPVAAVTDKPQPTIPPDFVPRWRLNEEIEKRRQAESRFTPKPVQQAEGAPKPEDFGDNYEAYQAAMIDHRVNQALAQREQRQAQETQSQRFTERVGTARGNFQAKVAEAQAKDPTVTAVYSLNEMLRPELQIPLMELDAPVEVSKHLLANPQELARINSMYPDQAAREFTRLEMKLTSGNGGPQKKPSAQAPNLDPVGGGAQAGKKNPYALGTSEEDYIASTRRIPK